MTERTRERLGGVFIAAIGAALAAYNWYLAVTEGRFYVKSSFLGAACVVLGIAMQFFPSPRAERAARGLPPAKGMQAITRRWWVVLLAAMAAGGLNLYFLGYSLPR